MRAIGHATPTVTSGISDGSRHVTVGIITQSYRLLPFQVLILVVCFYVLYATTNERHTDRKSPAQCEISPELHQQQCY